MTVLVEKFLLPLLEKLDRLLAFLLQVFYEYFEVLIGIQQVQLILEYLK